MKVLVDIPDDKDLRAISGDAVSAMIRESLNIELYDEGTQTGGVQITILDPHDDDISPEFLKYIKAGIEVIQIAGYMYDGCIVDVTDNIRGYTKYQAKDEVTHLNDICETLFEVIRELQFERGLIYMIKGEW